MSFAQQQPLNADIVEAARLAQLPHEHEINAFTDRCTMCGRSLREITEKRIPCDGFINHRQALPPW